MTTVAPNLDTLGEPMLLRIIATYFVMDKPIQKVRDELELTPNAKPLYGEEKFPRLFATGVRAALASAQVGASAPGRHAPLTCVPDRLRSRLAATTSTARG